MIQLIVQHLTITNIQNKILHIHIMYHGPAELQCCYKEVQKEKL